MTWPESIAESIMWISIAFMVHSCFAAAEPNKLIKVAVIDTGMDAEVRGNYCDKGRTDFTKTTIKDTYGHGTNISGLIHKHANGANYCQIILKYYKPEAFGENNLLNTTYALAKAINLNVDYINYSAGGENPHFKEKALILEALDRGIKIVVSAGNEAMNLNKNCNYYPACYDKRIIVVGSVDDYGRRLYSSNYGKVVDYWERGLNQCANGLCMSGTSQATAITTGKLINNEYNKR